MDASVGFLLENLKQLVVYQATLIKGAEHELKELNGELEMFKNILEESSKSFKKDKFFEQWEYKIREAVYDIEDIIDTCVTQGTAGKRSKSWFSKLFSIKNTIDLAEEVKKIRVDKVKPLMEQFKEERPKFSIADTTHQAVVAEARQEKTRHIVGLKDEAESFVKKLITESDGLEIHSIFGMPGLGKTTFAWKIFEDTTIQFEFPVRIWVNISEKLNMRKVLLDILLKFSKDKLPDDSVADDELIRTVKGHLEEEKFLMVMDDIWTINAWKKLEDMLPTNNKKGRVLITTRQTDVGNNASSQKEAYKLRFLNASESWELLQYKVFGKLQDVPKELEDIGKDIVSDCKGLPLSIVIIGGILEERTSGCDKNSTSAIKNEWKEVSSCVKTYLVEEGTNGLLRSVISLSYEELRYELKNCFLYLGVFPEDADIPARKLIQLWVSEGFIQETRGKRMEEVAREHLKDLIRRNLVMVREAKLDGEARICHIHDSIREICKTEGRKLNLFQEISKSEAHLEVSDIRRLSIHSHVVAFFSKKQNLPKARSFLCFSETPMTLKSKDIASIIDAFGLLRVYEAGDMKFQTFPPKLVQQLTHLRHLTLAVADATFTVLPEVVTELWNLQILLVDTPSHKLEIKGDIWKMRQLRHFKSRASIILKKKPGGDGEKLLTLSRLSPESCTDEVCQKSKALLTLGIEGDLRALEDSKHLGELESLNKLKLAHVVTTGAAENPMTRLPDSNRFPPKLRTLVLCGTRLGWRMMSIISALGQLEVLKLKDNAFVGNTWEANGSHFIHLSWLHIERAELRRWTANSDDFPRLRILYLNNCENLSEIPSGLDDSLEVVSLERVSKDVVSRAKQIVERQKKVKRVVRLEIAGTDRN